ncbi:MAG: FtsX-like permease family protein [Anaerolineae bacterium]
MLEQKPSWIVTTAQPLLMIWALIRLARKRIFYRFELSLLALLAVSFAIGLVTSAGFFAQAVDRVVLLQELEELTKSTGRPPFSMRVYMMPNADTPVTLQTAERLTAHVAGTLAAEIGLPLKAAHFEIESGGLMFQAQPGDSGSTGEARYLGNANVGYIEGVEDHIEITGDPMDAPPAGDILEAWVPQDFAAKAGINIGDRYSLGVTMASQIIPVRIRGFWKPANPKDPYWFTDPSLALSDTFLVRKEDYVAHVQPMVIGGSRFVAWQLILDETALNPARSSAYLKGFQRAMNVIEQFAPGARLDVSPIKPLENFVNRNQTLTILLLGFNLPAFGFLIYFLVLTSAIVARWQRRETAILVSRGVSLASVLGLTLVEQLLIFVIAVPLGLAMGVGIALLMGQTVSFLQFTSRPPMPVSLQGLDLRLVAAALLVSLIARLVPAWSAGQQSVVEAEREHARPVRPPFWYRYYLDLLLVLPTAYAYDQLQRHGSLAMLVTDRPADLFRDPLLVLVPALFILTASLLIMRLFPLIMRGLDWIAALLPWIAPHLALRQLGRQVQSYVNPLLLIMISLGLGIYTFSLAASLDQWLIDRMYYEAGADLSFVPVPASTEGALATDAAWILPLEDFLNLPGVANGMRVGSYTMRVSLSSGSRVTAGRLLGIDRVAFPAVAWFRRDFAPEPLGGLMNLLAQRADGILVPEEVLKASQLQIGDALSAQVSLGSAGTFQVRFTIVGAYRYFPTVYQDMPVGITNLDYLFSLTGGPVEHQIWLRLKPGASSADVLKAMRSMGIEAARLRDAGAAIREEQAKTERVGVFGTLTVGFLAAAAMALAGLLINTYASLNERLHSFAVLHAIGLQRRQILGQVLLEYIAITAYGAAGGALVGTFASYLFAPFFRIAGVKNAPLPPLLPVVPDDLITQMAIVFAGVMIGLELLVIALALIRRLPRLLTLRGSSA